jgi:hypothetical protein
LQTIVHAVVAPGIVNTARTTTQTQTIPLDFRLKRVVEGRPSNENKNEVFEIPYRRLTASPERACCFT